MNSNANIKWWTQHHWNCIKNSHLCIHTKKSPGVLYWTHSDVWIQALDNFKTDTKETGDTRNAVLIENARNLIDYKEIKWNLTRGWHNKSLINRICKRQTTLFGHVTRKEKLEHLVTTEMIEGKRSREKQGEKMLDGLTNKLKVGQVTDALKASRNRDAWKGYHRLHLRAEPLIDS